jgi:hypothetical protein
MFDKESTMGLKKKFRIWGTLFIVIGCYCRLNPRMILPSAYSYSGEFQFSPWGQLLEGFADLMSILVAAGVALIIISLTTLINDDE